MLLIIFKWMRAADKINAGRREGKRERLPHGP